MVFPELGPATDTEVALGQREEGGVVVVRTVSTKLEETSTLQVLCQLSASAISESAFVGLREYPSGLDGTPLTDSAL